MTFLHELRKAVVGLWSLVVGLKITGDAFFRKQITLHYPRKTVPNLDTFRGHIELVGRDDAPEIPRCVSCFKCAVNCPSGCIALECKEDCRAETQSNVIPPALLARDPGFAITPYKIALPGETVRRPTSFHLDFNFCSLCGLCVQGCPAGALRFSNDAYLAGFTKQEFQYDLLARLHEQAGSPDNQQG